MTVDQLLNPEYISRLTRDIVPLVFPLLSWLGLVWVFIFNPRIVTRFMRLLMGDPPRETPVSTFSVAQHHREMTTLPENLPPAELADLAGDYEDARESWPFPESTDAPSMKGEL